MVAIWKYSLTERINEIDLPIGATVLSFQCQKDIPTIWVLVEPNLVCEGEREKRIFEIFGTGQEIEKEGGFKYIGTAQQYKGNLIWHLFEKI